MSIAEKIEMEQIELAKNRINMYGVHVSPVKKAKKCRNKKTRTYSRNVVIKADPNSQEWKDYLSSLKKTIADKNRW